MKNTKKVKKAIKAMKNTKKVTPVKKTAVTTTPKVTKATYRSVADNIYYDGYSYRARITVNGKCNSKNFTSKTAAIRWRNEFRRTIG